jgi:hypothetical protein
MRLSGGLRNLTAAGGLVALLAAGGEIAPGALASAPTHKCANKVITVAIAGNPGEAVRTVKVTDKAISTQGVSCRAAYKFLDLASKGGAAFPQHYTCRTGHFRVPLGYIPQVCTKTGARIQYAAQGG